MRAVLFIPIVMFVLVVILVVVAWPRQNGDLPPGARECSPGEGGIDYCP